MKTGPRPALPSALLAFTVQALLTGLCATSSAQSQQATLAQPSDSAAQSASKTALNADAAAGKGTRLGSGDKLNIKIYERPDLSGEVTVRADGTVSLPLIGAFSVEGRLPMEVERDIAATLEKITGRVTTLVVDVVEWRPIYVVGAVDKPGTYAYKPHMTPLHALASAGGPYRQSALAGSRVEATREELLHLQNIEKLKSQLARRARLTAERDGKAGIEVPARLSELASQQEIETILNLERNIMAQRSQAFQQAEEGAKRKIELAGREIVLLKEQLLQAQEQVRLTKGELKDLLGLSERGMTSRPRLLETQRLVASLETSSREISASITRAELGLATAEKEKTLLAIDRRLKLEEEIRAVEEDLRASETALKASAQITGLSIRGGTRAEISVKYQVIRRDGDKQIALDVEESAELLPGDVLRVSQGQKM